jgi:hypothetical protein
LIDSIGLLLPPLEQRIVPISLLDPALQQNPHFLLLESAEFKLPLGFLQLPRPAARRAAWQLKRLVTQTERFIRFE